MTITLSHSLITNTSIDALAFYIYVLIKAECGKLSDSYNTTINKLVESCGYSVDRHKGKSNDKVMQAVRLLIENKLILIDQPIYTVKSGDLLSIEVDETNKIDKGERFAILTKDIWLRLKEVPVKYRINAVRICLYIIVSMYDNQTGLKISNATQKQMADIIKVSERVVSELISELANKQIIYCWKVKFRKGDKEMCRYYYASTEFDKKMVAAVENHATNYGKFKLIKDKE